MGKVYRGKIGFEADISGAMQRAKDAAIHRHFEEQQKVNEDAGKLGQRDNGNNRNGDDHP